MSGTIFTAMTRDVKSNLPWHPKDQDLIPESLFQKGIPSAEEAADITIKTLRCLGLDCDDAAKKKILEECLLLTKIGFNGRIFPKIISLKVEIDPYVMFEAVAGKVHEITRVLSCDDLPQMRIAIFRSDDETQVDPILNYLNMSFAYHAQGQNSIYQPKAFEITKKAFEASHDFLLEIATPDELFVWVLMDKIRQIPVDSSSFILTDGYMRLPVRYYSNYNKTGYDFYDAACVYEGKVCKQTSDAANFPEFGLAVVAY